ncbi:hypothetical protein KR51_00009910 [Rubidibacter lacunae KORDI 51-2]|uniref:Uncharacterized protein n=1 Tax=Rubidibacter lacunae KORDI 51-2 TaxID=582515 RepID=U5DNA4_9CHRO|nr:hypothetical protein KR51_00009910 [Rubidibacter lacunae KORDI 51-2]
MNWKAALARFASEHPESYIGLAEKVHKVNLGDRELMKSGFRHLAPDFRP